MEDLQNFKKGRRYLKLSGHVERDFETWLKDRYSPSNSFLVTLPSKIFDQNFEIYILFKIVKSFTNYTYRGEVAPQRFGEGCQTQ